MKMRLIVCILLPLLAATLFLTSAGANNSGSESGIEIIMTTADRVSPLFDGGDDFLPGEKVIFVSEIFVRVSTKPPSIKFAKDQKNFWDYSKMTIRLDTEELDDDDLKKWVVKNISASVSPAGENGLCFSIVSELTIPDNADAGKYAIQFHYDPDGKVLEGELLGTSRLGILDIVVRKDKPAWWDVNKKYAEAVRLHFAQKNEEALKILLDIETDSNLRDKQKVDVYATIGAAHIGLKNYSSAKEYLEKSIEHWKKTNDKINSPNIVFYNLRLVEDKLKNQKTNAAAASSQPTSGPTGKAGEQ